METKEQTKQSEFFSSLIEVQKKISALNKTKANPHYKTKYVPLSDILEEVKPILNEHGLFLSQTFSVPAGGKTEMITKIISSAGESIESTCLLDSKDPHDPQKVASAITYYRRYSITSMLGIEENDDDGELASKPAPDPVSNPLFEKFKAEKDKFYTLTTELEMSECSNLEELSECFKKASLLRPYVSKEAFDRIVSVKDQLKASFTKSSQSN